MCAPHNTAPSLDNKSRPLSNSSTQLNAMAYIADVPPRSGGTTFWPGSHKRMYYAFEYESNSGPGPSALETRKMNGGNLNDRQLRYKEIFNKAVAEIEPVEIYGEAGDVIFCAGRATG